MQRTRQPIPELTVAGMHDHRQRRHLPCPLPADMSLRAKLKCVQRTQDAAPPIVGA